MCLSDIQPKCLIWEGMGGEGGGAFDLLDFKIFGLDLLSNWMKS